MLNSHTWEASTKEFNWFRTGYTKDEKVTVWEGKRGVKLGLTII
jgi:hypothetical protein